MGIKGCACLERHKGHIVILIYFFIFGSGFLTSSSLYLNELYKIDTEPVPECVLGLLAQDSRNKGGNENGSEIGPGGRVVSDCADVSWWIIIAWVGIIYGCICILAGFGKLVPILRKLSTCGAAVAVNKLRTRRSSSFRDAAGGRTVARANAEVRQFVQDRGDRRSRNWASCSQFTRICVKFVVIMNLWLISLVMPWYIAVNVFNSDGIRAKDENLYYPALALFGISIVSLAVSLASCIFIVIEHDPGSWDDDEEDGEPEAVTVGNGTTTTIVVDGTTIVSPEVEPLNPPSTSTTNDVH